MTALSHTSHDYQVGGSLPINAPTYVTRQTDRNLYSALQAGEFCYILTARQVGKSSLRVRTMQRFQAEGVACAAVDITAIGTTEITPEQWYAGMIDSIMNSLDLDASFDLDTWWNDLNLLSPVQRFSKFIADVLLTTLSQPTIIFIDEIDSVLSLGFNLDDFFAVIRDCYNNRADQPEYRRLTFTLIGVASPSDLIRDHRRTPFNIGRAIELTGLRLEESSSLLPGLASKTSDPKGLLQHILDWTGGQPFLTQKLCKLVQTSAEPIPAGEEAQWLAHLVQNQVIEHWEMQDEPSHLRTVRDRLLWQSEQRAGRLLQLYHQALQPGGLEIDNSPEQTELRLTGIVARRGDSLTVSNPIYAAVFNATWLERVLASLRPYSAALTAWVESDGQDESRLLRGQALRDAQTWAVGKQLNPEDHQFLTASQDLDYREIQADLEAKKVKAALEAERQANQILSRAGQRATQRIRIGTAILGMTLVLSVLTGTLAFFYARDATLQRRQSVIRDRIYTAIARSQLNFTANHGLDALLNALDAARSLQQLTPPSASLQQQVQFTLAEAVYNVREQNRWQGHSARVMAIGVSPDGQTIASASADNAIKLWNPDGTLQQTLQGHTDSVLSLSIRPDGKAIATGSADHSIKLWNLDGTLLRTLEGHQDAVTTLAFSPDGQTLASAGSDKMIRLWNQDGKVLTTLKGHGDHVLHVSFSPDGQILLSASDDRTVRLWRRNGTLLKTLELSEPVWRAIFSPDGQTIATASAEGSITLWDRNGILRSGFAAHDKVIRDLRFSPDGQLLASASEDGTIRLWHLDGALLATLQGHAGTVSGISFTADGKSLISASWDKTIRLWSRTGTLLDVLREHQERVWSVDFSPDGTLLASAGSDGAIVLRNLKTRTVKLLHSKNGSLFALSFSPDNTTLAAATEDGKVQLWDRRGTALKTLSAGSQPLTAIAFSPDGAAIATGSMDKTVRVLTHDGTLQHTLSGHQKTVWGVSFSPDGQTLASASADGTLKLWQRDGTLRHTLSGHRSEVLGVSFSPDGQTLASASEDGTIKLWRPNGTFLRTLEGHQQAVWKVRFSPDGQHLVSASEDRTVRIWSLDGRLLKTLMGHTDHVSDASFSPDSRMLVSGSSDETVRIWNAETLDFNGLVDRACHWVYSYLKTNPTLDEQNHQLCNRERRTGNG
jgi:WD40 repeat protein